MSGVREKRREFRLEESMHRNGHWKLSIGSHRKGKPAVIFILTDREVDGLGKLLLGAETSDRVLEASHER